MEDELLEQAKKDLAQNIDELSNLLEDDRISLPLKSKINRLIDLVNKYIIDNGGIKEDEDE